MRRSCMPPRRARSRSSAAARGSSSTGSRSATASCRPGRRPALAIDQLFVNGQRQHMARYPNFDPKARHFNGCGGRCLQPGAGGALGRPGRRLHPRHARRALGRLSLPHHRQERGRQARPTKAAGRTTARWACTSSSASWRTSSRNSTRPASGSTTPRPARSTSIRRPGVDLATATVEAVRLRHLVEFRGTQEKPVRFVTLRGLDLPPRGAHVHGQQGAAAAQRLDHLSRRRGVLQRRGGLRARGLRLRPGRRQRRLRQQLQPPRHRPRLPHRTRPAPTASPSSATRRPCAARCSSTARRPDVRDASTARPARRPTTTRPTASWRTA